MTHYFGFEPCLILYSSFQTFVSGKWL